MKRDRELEVMQAMICVGIADLDKPTVARIARWMLYRFTLNNYWVHQR